MDREKQIEEMAKDVCENVNRKMCADGTCPQTWNCPYNNTMAKILIEQGYRKINDNEVVISKEEKQKLLKEMYEQGKFDAIADLEKEGKVVISKEEYERLKQFEYQVRSGVCFTQKMWFDFCIEDSKYQTSLQIKAKEQGSKETAEKCIEIIKRYVPPKSGLELEIARKFGVDLGEE